MDEFLRDIHFTVFKEWVIQESRQSFDVEVIEEDIATEHMTTVVLKNAYAYAQVRFNPDCITELEVTETKTNATEFYLHFQMNNLHHAKALFTEFLDAIASLEDKQSLKILLSCSGGLTTGFFAMQLNDAAQTLSLDYQFDAVSYTKLFDEGSRYDVILLAPQISYLHAKVKSVFPNKIIIDIPAKVFAKYDVAKMVSQITKEVEKHKKKDHVEKTLTIRKDIKNPGRILVIVIIRHDDQARLAYRVYDQEDIILDNEIIKRRMNMRDIDDIINFVLIKHPDIHMIGLSAPGIINDGCLYFPEIGFDHFNVLDYFVTKYNIPLILSNDVNAMAVGAYASQDDYEDISFIFMPRLSTGAGVGHIINGNLHSGRRNFAGEVKYLAKTYTEEEMQKMVRTEEGSIRLVSLDLISIICVLAPEVIFINCDMIPDVSLLREEIEKHIPSEYMPKLKKAIHLREYMLLGQMIICAQKFAGIDLNHLV